jgi:Protein of unknown function (DUF2000)
MSTTVSVRTIGFTDEEIDTAAPTRSARLKWVVIVNEALPPGRAVNAAVCAAAATSPRISGILGEASVDADGNAHEGLPWAGCSILVANAESLRRIRAKGASSPDCFVADTPLAAQETRVYDEYLDAVSNAPADAIDYAAISLVGPRNRVDRITGRLPLMA